MDIATLKEEARTLEQEGRAAEALALYRKALARLEGTQEIWRELPLYVKAGDLNLKLRDAKTAIAMYERAAKRYAQYGSGKSVLALCAKILRVSPSRTYAYLAFARLMIERGHVAEAAKVLGGYAEHVKLGKVREVIQRLGAREPEEVRPVLEMLLEVAGRAENAKLKAVDPQPQATDQPTHDEREDTDGPGERGAETDVRAAPSTPAAGSQPLAVEATRAGLADTGLPDRVGEVEAAAHPAESEGEAESEPDEAQRPWFTTGPELPGDDTPAGSPIEEPRLPEKLAESHDDERPPATETVDVMGGYATGPGVGGLYRPESTGREPAGLEFSPTIEPPPQHTIEPPPQQEPAHHSRKQDAESVLPQRARERPESVPVPPRQPVTRSGPRPQVTFTTHKPRPKAARRGWLWAALGVIVVGGGGAGLVMAGVVGGGDGGSETVGERALGASVPLPGDSLSVTGAVEDTGRSVSEGDATVTSSADPTAAPTERATPEATDTGATDVAPPDLPAGLADSLVLTLRNIPIDTAIAEQPAVSNVATAPQSDPADLAVPDLPPGVTLAGAIIVIRGLAIESVTEFPGGGHRVVQLLGSGERLVLTAIPVATEAADTVESGAVTVRAMPGASTVGSVRYAGHLVDAQGRIDADMLTMLLGRLVELRP